MKLSTDCNSDFYNPDMIGPHVRVLLDGVEEKYVTEADEEGGYIIRHKVAEDGNLVVNGDYLVFEKAEGHVEIIDARLIE
ncbi:hypothetical protein EOA32_29225 [Mesorhizobium sp. M1A.F.Ca.ET.072.01.1.1]|uniref:hypothetical protein n=1 Tax=Mesorhizobium sp. M1A.F.Ca.ET.072.01.1.1 TaxID=2496753 RepID=UPI000FD26E6D|nr:hypothetical protein [Mesorhizobium sp. M1A.F.Ca.ET.072.01.1.1]RUW47288.1 hypothetical protein EOA32_29225 [Mesorhizobium sp. M1A.F.Ca.ET.072.01.1.1]TIV04337.1 MAG: hypothetical protein E5W04_03920 [Mesorhizobium sp.]